MGSYICIARYLCGSSASCIYFCLLFRFFVIIIIIIIYWYMAAKDWISKHTIKNKHML